MRWILKALKFALFGSLLLSDIVRGQSVQQSLQALGTTGNYAVTFNWTAGPTGSVPSTTAQLPGVAQGYRILEAETAPGMPSPSANYSITITDPFGADLMMGQMSGLSATVPALFAASTATPPIMGAFTFGLTANIVAAAQGQLTVYFGPVGLLNAQAGSVGPAGPAGPPGPAGNLPSSITSNFTWSQTPLVNVTGGLTATFPLAPVPNGVNGSNSNFYIYISGGTGTAETCLVNGGTAVSGAASGNITCIPANSHSGAYTIATATAGGSECIQSYITAAVGGGCRFPVGINKIYAPMVVPEGLNFDISGDGLSTNLQTQSTLTTGSVFWIDNVSGSNLFYNTIRDLSINTISATGAASLTGVTQNRSLWTILKNLTITGPGVGIRQIGNTSALVIDAFFYQSLAASSYGVSISPAIGYSAAYGNVQITNMTAFPIDVAHTSCTAGIYISALTATTTAGLWINNANIYKCAYGLDIYAAGTGVVSEVFDSNSVYGTSGTSGIKIDANDALSVVSQVEISGSQVIGSGVNGIIISTATSGQVDSVSLNGLDVRNSVKDGILIGNGSAGIHLNNVSSSINSTGTANTYSCLHVTANTNKFYVTGGTYGTLAGGYCKYGIYIESGTSDLYNIQGVNFNTNDTANLNDLGSGVHKVIAQNLGIDTVAATASEGATLTLPATDDAIVYVTGTGTNITTISGCWIGRSVVLIGTNAGGLVYATGGNILLGSSQAQYASRGFRCDGTNWY